MIKQQRFSNLNPAGDNVNEGTFGMKITCFRLIF